AMDVQSIHKIGAMHGDSIDAQLEHSGDLLVGVALRDQLQHLLLALGEQLKPVGGVAISRLEPAGIAPPGSHCFHRGGQIHFDGVLQQIALCACVKGVPDVVVLGVHAEDKDGRGWRLLENFTCSLDAVQTRHGHVHYHHAWSELTGHMNGVAPRAGLADDVNIWIVFQDSAKAFANQLVVVYEQDSDLFHTVAACVKGISRITSVPPSGGRRHSSLPCKISARPRMAIIPSPPVPDTGIPTPWSSTSSRK